MSTQWLKQFFTFSLRYKPKNRSVAQSECKRDGRMQMMGCSWGGVFMGARKGWNEHWWNTSRKWTWNPLPAQNGSNELWQFQLMPVGGGVSGSRGGYVTGAGGSGAGDEEEALIAAEKCGNWERTVESEHFRKDHSHFIAWLRRSIWAWQQTTVFNDFSA